MQQALKGLSLIRLFPAEADRQFRDMPGSEAQGDCEIAAGEQVSLCQLCFCQVPEQETAALVNRCVRCICASIALRHELAQSSHMAEPSAHKPISHEVAHSQHISFCMSPACSMTSI